jgi:hypothetical protein
MNKSVTNKRKMGKVGVKKGQEVYLRFDRESRKWAITDANNDVLALVDKVHLKNVELETFFHQQGETKFEDCGLEFRFAGTYVVRAKGKLVSVDKDDELDDDTKWAWAWFHRGYAAPGETYINPHQRKIDYVEAGFRFDCQYITEAEAMLVSDTSSIYFVKPKLADKPILR